MNVFKKKTIEKVGGEEVLRKSMKQMRKFL